MSAPDGVDDDIVLDQEDVVDDSGDVVESLRKGLVTAMPSAIVRAGSSQGLPARQERSIAGAPLAHTPTMRVPGLLRLHPMRDSGEECAVAERDDDRVERLRPPERARTPIVPAPSAISTSRPSSTSRAPLDFANSAAAR